MKFPTSLHLLNPSGFTQLKVNALRSIRGRNEAFSLVEVTLALGIVSFAMVTMVGLIPLGLVTLRTAMDSTTESQIVQEIGSQTRLTAFSQLSAQYSGTVFYYDEEGTFLTNSSALNPVSAPAATRYWVTATLVGPSFPGSTNAPTASPTANNIQGISLQIISGSTASTLNRTVHTNVILVPNAGS